MEMLIVSPKMLFFIKMLKILLFSELMVWDFKKRLKMSWNYLHKLSTVTFWIIEKPVCIKVRKRLKLIGNLKRIWYN